MIDPASAFALVIDKPNGISSFGVIRKLRKILHIKKIGHAGTLDPMATGVLICAFNRGTKKISEFMDQKKIYSGTIRLGEKTDSADADSPVVERAGWEHIDEALIQQSLKKFHGEILQIPPMVSAIKMGGERLYKKARRGEKVEIPARKVQLDEFKVSEQDGQNLHFEVSCSKGFYVRSLAVDFAEELGTLAHLSALRREAIGSYSVGSAITLDELACREAPLAEHSAYIDLG